MRSRTSQAGGLGTLAVCAAGICGCYLYFGVLQERLFTGETRMGATFTLVTACLTNAFVAILWQTAVKGVEQRRGSVMTNGPHVSQQARLHHRQLFLTSFCYVTAMVCSNEAIQYVSYPVAVLAKSCKLIPTMLLGQIVEGRRYSKEEWMAAVLISFGIVVFHFSRMLESLSLMASDKDETWTDGIWSNSQFGMALLLFSLLMDGLLSSTQNLLKMPSNGFQPPTAVETMLFVNLYALVFVIPLSIIQGQWEDGLLTLADSARRGHHVVFWNLLMINLVVGVGQIFIFLTIQLYSSMVVTTITTTRKFLTILLSVWTFGHRFTHLQWTAIVVVFAGLYLVILVQRREHLGKLKVRMPHTPANSTTSCLIAIILVQWIIVSVLLHRLPSRETLGKDQSILSPLPVRLDSASIYSSHRESLLASGELFSDSQAEGVFATVIFKAPKWFHLRYVVMLQNALSNLPRNWRLQIFINEPWVKDNLPSYHPGLDRIIAADPRVSVTPLPDRLLSLKPKNTLADPWFWRSMVADRVLLFSGNGAFCGNTFYDFEWLRDLDFVGVPSHNHNGVGGHGETHSYRNRPSMLRVIEYASEHGIKIDNLTENDFFVRTMLKMNQEGVSEFRLATPKDTFRFGGVVNLTDGGALKHLPLVVSGTMARLAYEERDSVLKHCPEIKVIFPSLHEPACFGAHPDPAKCRLSICALQDNVPTHGC